MFSCRNSAKALTKRILIKLCFWLRLTIMIMIYILKKVCHNNETKHEIDSDSVSLAVYDAMGSNISKTIQSRHSVKNKSSGNAFRIRCKTGKCLHLFTYADMLQIATT